MTPVLADVGLPMIFVQLPMMVLALVPVILVEGLLIRRWVSQSHRDTFWGVTKANVLSTLIGVPAAWLAMLIVEFVIGYPLVLAADKFHWSAESLALKVSMFLLTAAWVGPPNEGSEVLTVAAASAVLLVPSFYISVWIERRACLRAWPSVDPQSVRRGVFFANVASYGVLFLLACAWITYELMRRGR